MNLSSLQRTQQQLIQVKSIEEFGIFGIIPASLVLSKVCFRSEKKYFAKKVENKTITRKSFAAAQLLPTWLTRWTQLWFNKIFFVKKDKYKNLKSWIT